MNIAKISDFDREQQVLEGFVGYPIYFLSGLEPDIAKAMAKKKLIIWCKGIAALAPKGAKKLQKKGLITRFKVYGNLTYIH